MADFDDIEFLAGQTDYIGRLNALRQRAEDTLTEIENARNGNPSLLAHILQQMTGAEVSALIASTAILASGLTQNFNAAGYRIIGAADPQQPQDLATRSWVLANLTVGGDPSGVAITGLNIGSLGADQVVSRNGAALVGRTIAAGSARVTVAITAGAITIDVPANAFPSLGNANTWTQPQTFASAEPTLELNETDAAANAKRWRMRAAGGALELQALSDDGSIANTLLAIARSGSTLVSATFSARLYDSRGNVRGINLRTSNANTDFTFDDNGGEVNKTDTSTPSFRIRTDANGNYEAGTSFIAANDGNSGNLTISLEAGVTLMAGTTSGPLTLPPGESRLLRRVGANSWRAR
jgi:hypothetical protein